MLQEERTEKIVQFIEQMGFAKISDLVERFEVSKPTIFRDLTRLERNGVIIRTHGGAKSAKRGTKFEPKHTLKETIALNQKRNIALKAKEFIRSGETILLDSGTTTLMLAQQIIDMSDITVITNDVKIAMCLCENENIDLVVIGGQRRKGVFSLIGPFTENMLQQLNVDKVFLGCDAVDLSKGITNANIDESNIKKMMLQLSQNIILLADSSKFGSVAFMKIADITEINSIITDKGFLHHQTLEDWTHHNIDIVLA